MAFEVEVSDEFREWYEPLSESEQLSVGRVIELLEEKGPFARACWVLVRAALISLLVMRMAKAM